MIKSQKGFTLIEMIIVIVIIAILLSSGAVLLNKGLSAGFSLRGNSYATSNIRVAFERMNDEIKNARSPTAADLTAGANALTFIDTFGNSIAYTLSGGNLLRNTRVLASDITSLSFTYLNATDATTTDVTQVRCIVYSATTNPDNTIVTLTSTTCPRNYV